VEACGVIRPPRATEARMRVLRAVVQLQGAHALRLPPTRDELGRALGITPNAVREHLLGLERLGFILRMDRIPRGLMVTDLGHERLSTLTVKEVAH
jgi:DNA-binding MarR family transcriptional regulator